MHSVVLTLKVATDWGTISGLLYVWSNIRNLGPVIIRVFRDGSFLRHLGEVVCSVTINES